MKINYFEKRGQIWLDFRDASGKRRRMSSGCETQAEAVKAALGVIARSLQAAALPVVPPSVSVPEKVGGPTLAEAFKLGMKVREEWMQSANKKTLEGTFRCLGLPPSTPMAKITRDYVRELRAEWRDEPGKRKDTTLSASTINHRLSMLSVLLEVCDLPPHTVKHLSTKGNQRTRRMPLEETERMLKWCADSVNLGASDFGPLIEMGLETAARQGELLKLRWFDVRNGEVTFRKTKNRLTRTIPLTKRAQAILEARRGFPDGPFAMLTTDRCTALWALMRTDMGLDADDEFVFHSLRHEAVTRMVEWGSNSLAIQAVAGHTNIATTQGYVTRSMEAMRRAMRIESDPEQQSEAPAAESK